ncbi:MAG: SDR family NAD(P)-dependent oxidoreductase [Deltaproteobacteria bacterium]|nr:MAG: SDR family NAD(P)-dependent oxidoreductase [Deltaproteobacteria bacterium]
MSKRFQDCVVVITGGSTGIGASAAHQFAAEGAHVVLNARGQKALDEVAQAINDKGGSASTFAADVGDMESCKNLIQNTVETYGRLDVLVNNAGVHHRGPLTNHDAEAFATMVDVNLRAPIVLTRLALPHLQKVPRGAVVNVASLAGRICLPDTAVYSSTKFGMRAFSRALSEELRETSVSVSVVSPGPVDTGFIMSDIDEVADITFSQTMSTADQVAALVLDCAADGKPERTIPQMGGFLTNLGYLLPGVYRMLRPMMQRKGRRNKAKYKRLYGQE